MVYFIQATPATDDDMTPWTSNPIQLSDGSTADVRADDDGYTIGAASREQAVAADMHISDDAELQKLIDALQTALARKQAANH